MLELLSLKLWLVRDVKDMGLWFLFLYENYFAVLRGRCAMMSNVKVERGVMGVLRRWVGVSPTTIVNLLTASISCIPEFATQERKNWLITQEHFFHFRLLFILPQWLRTYMKLYDYLSLYLSSMAAIAAEKLVKLVQEGRAVRPWLVLAPSLSHQLFIPPRNGEESVGITNRPSSRLLIISQ
jgi:hypothetical protein